MSLGVVTTSTGPTCDVRWVEVFFNLVLNIIIITRLIPDVCHRPYHRCRKCPCVAKYENDWYSWAIASCHGS